MFTDSLRSQDMEIFQITGQFKIWTLQRQDLLLRVFARSSKTGISNVNVFSGKVVLCCLWGCGSVLCHNEWLSILLCLCVLCLFVFALWIFGKITCISDAFCPLVHYTSHDDPGWWNTDHKVCIVAVSSTNVHTHTRIQYMPHGFIADTQTTCMQAPAKHTKDIHTNLCKYMHKHILNPHSHTQTPHKYTLSLSLCSPCVFFHRFSCHLVRVRHPDCSSCSQKGGKHVLLCVTPPLFPPGLNFKSNAPPFSTSVPSPPPPLPPPPLHLLFLRYDPFQLLSSVRLPLQLPSLPLAPFSTFFPPLSFSFSFAVQSVSNLSFVYYDVWVR